MSKVPEIRASTEDYLPIGYVYRCPVCHDSLEFEQTDGQLNISGQHSSAFICYTCDHEGKEVDQDAMRFCRESFLKVLGNLPASMRSQLYLTEWSEVNR